MLVVSDIDDVFLPKPNDLLVNLAEARESLEILLDKIGTMFQDNSIIGSALGPALQAGFKLMVSLTPCQSRNKAHSNCDFSRQLGVRSWFCPLVFPARVRVL